MDDSSGSSDEMQMIDINNDDDDNDDDSIDSDGIEAELSEEVMTKLRNNDSTLTGLEIQYCGPNNGIDWDNEGQYISQNTHLKYLRIEDGDCKSIFRGVSRNRSISHLGLEGGEIDHGDMIDILIPFFENNSNLRRFEFMNSDLSDKRSQEGLLSALKSVRCLRDLALTCCTKLDDSTAGKFVASLSDHVTKLKSLWLGLYNSGKQWCIELDKLLQNPASKLAKLELRFSAISDEGAIILGAAIRKSRTLKTLCLAEIDEITTFGWVALLSSVGSCSSLKELDVSDNQIGDEAAAALSNSLAINTSVEVLELGWLDIGVSGIMAIGYGLTRDAPLKKLSLQSNESINSAEWVDFFGILRNNNSALESLNLSHNEIDDEGVIAIIDTLRATLKFLSLSHNQHITIVGLRALATLIQQHNSCLEDLTIPPGSIIDEVVVMYANALFNNSTMKVLHLDNTKSITWGWAALAKVLCNKTDIESICSSNHKLQKVYSLANAPSDLVLCLELNKNEDKAEVVRQKIIKYHFLDGESNIDKFVSMELTELPQAISWVGRNNTGASLLYKLCKSIPTLFDSESKAKAAECRKRKSDGL